ncbi:MAG: hypothetical protein MI806_04000 [Minwuiales bacterium]|nr:hypothetical protein [Minwuiales bacterium]
MPDRGQNREYLIEFKVVGNAVKVSAVDPLTMTEVSIVGPLTAGEEELKRNAVNKLKYRLKQLDEANKSQKGRGRLV